MEKTVLLVLLSHRRDEAVKVQQILTEYGCIIKTRLGIHDGVLDKCSEVGLLMLELVGDETEINKLNSSLQAIKGISAKLVKLSLNN
ncbi:MAG: hypothetical protein A2086_07000 [Spirochaetes bacterium GWD1_27_9]|nr:MAG: hypothetical protein A2Z98_05825 [Spirochaetes bacterium GWB1_27_13]OHD35662.1 MAG: hypothetical protein A2086_07000 [Spirochaetes bacterium GWD1_27_9]